MSTQITITITWDPNGGSVTPTSSQYTYKGEPVSLPIPTNTGLNFVGWFTQPSGGDVVTDVGINNKPTTDVTYYAQWIKGNPVRFCTYNVIHKRQALDGTYPEDLYEIEEFVATIGETVIINVKEYTGFTSPLTKIIELEGPIDIEYEYTRNKYNISWDVNGGEELTGDYTNGSVYFETPIVKPNDPIKSGYTFTEWRPSVPEIMPANDITFTASYDLEKTYLGTEIIDVVLENVEVGKIATDKWINNIIGEPEKTSFVYLYNFFNTNFGSNITGECVTGNDLGRYTSTNLSTNLNKCITQSQFIQIFSIKDNISNRYIIEKGYTFNISMNTSTNLEFIITPENELSIPNYPDPNGFVMYYTIGSNPKLYKIHIPINKICGIRFNLTNEFGPITIRRIPLYYWSHINACILPKITIQNNSGAHTIIGDTPITSQIIE